MSDLLKWQVMPVDKAGRPTDRPVYVAAPNAERALACGKYWWRVMRLKRARDLVARRYHPERDWSIANYIRPVAAKGGDE